MLDYCAVYIYIPSGKSNRDIILQNYQSHYAASDGKIVAVSIGGRESWIDNTVYVDDWLPFALNRKSDYIPFFDHIFYAYLRSDSPVSARRYILLDWDTYTSGTSMPEALQDIWDVDLGSTSLLQCGSSPYFWCGSWSQCIHPLVYFRSFSVAVFSRSCALQLANYNFDALCEGFTHSHGSVRNPTTALHLGYSVLGSDRLGETVREGVNYNVRGHPGVYHSVRFKVEQNASI